jgi:hypothetical protein
VGGRRPMHLRSGRPFVRSRPHGSFSLDRVPSKRLQLPAKRRSLAAVALRLLSDGRLVGRSAVDRSADRFLSCVSGCRSPPESRGSPGGWSVVLVSILSRRSITRCWNPAHVVVVFVARSAAPGQRQAAAAGDTPARPFVQTESPPPFAGAAPAVLNT